MSMRGFTLIEILIVIAIFSVLISLGLFMSMETFRGTLNRSERDIVVNLLQKARSRALANIQQASWGVCYIAPEYIIFRGSECISGLPTNETVPANTANSIVFSSPIVFSQLSATTTGGSITITQNGRTAAIIVNQEGMIDW